MSSNQNSEFEIKQSSVGRVQGHEVELEQSSIVFVKGDEVELQKSAALAVLGRAITLNNSAVLIALAPRIVGLGRTAFTLHGLAGFAIGFALAKWLNSRTRK